MVKYRPKRKKRRMLNHSTWGNCYSPILPLPHLLVSIVSSMEYSYSSTKRIHFPKNRTVSTVGISPSVFTPGFYSTQVFLNGLHHQFRL